MLNVPVSVADALREPVRKVRLSGLVDEFEDEE